jgi:iron complex transport system ATP-binding protein
MTLMSLQNFDVKRGGKQILQGITVQLKKGEVVGLIGPNGAGKTTLMRAALGLIPAQGRSSLASMTARDRGRAVAWMPQSRESAWPVDVETVVRLGRTPHLGAGQKMTDADAAAVERAISLMALQDYRHRIATQLSGGEQARVLIARSLAQEAPLLMADEPTAGLDPAHQISTMQTFTQLAQGGHSVLVSLHDLGLAARHCTRLVLLCDGAIAADGLPRDVLTPDLIRAAFGISAHLEETPNGMIFQPLEVLP